MNDLSQGCVLDICYVEGRQTHKALEKVPGKRNGGGSERDLKGEGGSRAVGAN